MEQGSQHPDGLTMQRPRPIICSIALRYVGPEREDNKHQRGSGGGRREGLKRRARLEIALGAWERLGALDRRERLIPLQSAN